MKIQPKIMNWKIRLIIALQLLVISFCVGATGNDGRNKSIDQIQALSLEIRQADADVKNLSRQIELLQKDQANYRIEKDLLKEAYASNLQGINVVITIVFGIFGVVGYLGVKSIKEIKTDYATELEKLRELKGKFETDLEVLRRQQSTFEAKINEIAQVNDTQERRLKVMEIIEKVGSLIDSKSYVWALEHISVAIELDKDNLILLRQKAACLAKLARLPEAIAITKRLIDLEPQDISHVSNVLEFLALSGSRDEFNHYYSRRQSEIDNLNEGSLTVYLKSTLAITTNNKREAKSILLEFLKSRPNDAVKHLGNWSFDEAVAMADKMNPSESKNLLVALIKYFKGDLRADEISGSFASIGA